MELPFPARPVFGARAHDIADGVTPLELGRRAREVGVERLQLALMKSYPQVAGAAQLSVGLGEQFRAALAQSGVTVAIFSCYQNLIHPDDGARRQIIDRFKAYLKHAEAFGARLVVSETGSVLPGLGYTQANFTDGAFHQVIETVAELCDTAAHYGVLVGIEPGLNHPVHNLARTAELVEQVNSPNLAIVLDPFNLLRTVAAGGDAKTDPASYLEQLDRAFDMFGGSIEAIQLKDYAIDPTGKEPNGLVTVPVGEGDLPGSAAVERIWAAKPGIDIIFEGTPAPKIPKALTTLVHPSQK